MKNDVSKMIIMSILIEGIITYINELFVNEFIHWQIILSLCLGLLIAVSYKLDLPKYLNIESSIPYIGTILTGVLISRGSNYLYDLISKLNNLN